ncbi:MAG: PadR family transcriptional regulator [Streptococcaceae bacterium]|nr:PadR family transcriptional regulator [Streptococcaceae bacterium]
MRLLSKGKVIMQGKDVVLGLLNGQSRSGYEIKELIETRLKYFFDGTAGMIYPTLKKLEKEGKVEKNVVFQEGRPNKNVYTITDEGKADFINYLSSETEEETLKSDFLVRIYFGKELETDQIKAIISREIDRKERNLNDLQLHFEKWQSSGMDSLQTIAYKYGIAYYDSVLKLLTESLEELNRDSK